MEQQENRMESLVQIGKPRVSVPKQGPMPVGHRGCALRFSTRPSDEVNKLLDGLEHCVRRGPLPEYLGVLG